MMGIGLGIFLLISAAGLSVIPRYVVVPSILFNVGVAVALFGWTLVSEPRARIVAIGVALVSLLLVAWRTPAWVLDMRKLQGQTLFVKRQHQYLKAILEDPSVVPLLASCGPITVPTHSAMPVIEYETGLSKNDLQATIAQKGPPTRGLLFIDITFNFEPAAARSVTGTAHLSAPVVVELPTVDFKYVASNPFWRVYANCGGVPGENRQLPPRAPFNLYSCKSGPGLKYARGKKSYDRSKLNLPASPRSGRGRR